jgi:ABC-type Fe3+/spermidine/putrescine transport system ATPase subunit
LLADEILILVEGTVLEAGPAAELLGRPGSPQAAALLGVENVREGTVEGPGSLESRGVRIAAPTAGLSEGAPVLWRIAPERISIGGPGPRQAVLLDEIDLGAACELTLSLGEGLDLTARTPAARRARYARVAIELPAEAIEVWPAGRIRAAP